MLIQDDVMKSGDTWVNTTLANISGDLAKLLDTEASAAAAPAP